MRTTSVRNQRLIASIGRDVSLMVDAQSEAANNLIRGEGEFLRQNLRSCFALARSIGRKEKRAIRLLKGSYQ